MCSLQGGWVYISPALAAVVSLLCNKWQHRKISFIKFKFILYITHILNVKSYFELFTTCVHEFSKLKLCLFVSPTFIKDEVLAKYSNHTFNVISPTEFNSLWNQVCVWLNSGKYSHRASCYFYYHIWVKNKKKENYMHWIDQGRGWGTTTPEVNFILAATKKSTVKFLLY